MDLSTTIIILAFLFVAFCLWAIFYLGDQRNWVTICKEFAISRGLIYDSTSVDTSICFFGNYAGFCFKMEVVLFGGFDALPPGLNLRITINDVGQVGDSFKISEAHLFSGKLISFGNPDLDHDYVISKISGKYYNELFKTPSFHEIILKYHPNILSLANQELAFSKRLTEKQLEGLLAYSNFILHIGTQINCLKDAGIVDLEKGVPDSLIIGHENGNQQ